MREIPLYGKKAAGRVALIDDEDCDLVSAYRWAVWERRRPNGATWGPYARTIIHHGGGRDTGIFMHKLITGYPRTDHRNGNGLDNQRGNLRPTNAAQNNHNQGPVAGHSSRFKGVGWDKRARKWKAAIKVSGKSRHLGLFASEEAAAHAYNKAALAIQGEYAYAAREVPESGAA